MMRTAWELSAGLLSFVVALGLGYWFGRTLDGWLGTAPWLLGMFVVLRVRRRRAERVPHAVHGARASGDRDRVAP